MTSRIIRLWNRDIRITSDQENRIIDFVLTHLSNTPKGRESLSFMIEEVRRGTRMKFPTRLSDAETMFEELGFTIRKVYKYATKKQIAAFEELQVARAKAKISCEYADLPRLGRWEMLTQDEDGRWVTSMPRQSQVTV